jgi:hypothetical protein
MRINPLDAVLDKVTRATLEAKMWNGLGEANSIKEEEFLRTPIVEAIAIKSLDQNHDTSGLFADIAKELPKYGESTGRKIDPSEFDKIVGKAVKAFKEEQLLGTSERSKGNAR